MDLTTNNPPRRIQRRLRIATAKILRSLARSGSYGDRLARKIYNSLPREHSSYRWRVSRLGFWFLLDLRDNLQRELFYLGRYGDSVLSLLKQEVRSGDIVVDVGANIGIYALPLASRLDKLGAGNVIAFEPAPDTAAILKTHMAMNGIRNVEIVQIALGSHRSSGHLRYSERHGIGDVGTRSLYGTGTVTHEVLIQRFDDWAHANGLQGLDIVKIDVEGAELDVLKGFMRSIQQYRPRCILMEILVQPGSDFAVQLKSLVGRMRYKAEGPSIDSICVGRTGGLGSNVLLRPIETSNS